LTWLGNTSHP